MKDILSEIEAERQRQNEKWGEQNHPMLGTSRSLLDPPNTAYPGKDVLRRQLKVSRERCNSENIGWFDILQEEVCEAFLETKPEKQRAEMIQVAAVAVQIIEYLDRKKV